jgi:2-polyprenyl-6-methoxyphenol hydroxylase-like FAD-dependent oxidoreductase
MLRATASRFNVTVFERDESKETRSQGYYLELQHMGVDALRPIAEKHLPDLKAQLFNNTNALSGFLMADEHLRILMSAKNPGGVFVDRVKLRESLMKDVDIRWGKKFRSYEERADGVTATFADGSAAECDVLIGCDGAHSNVRKQRAPGIVYEELEYTNTAGVLPVEEISPKLQELLKTGLLRVLGQEGHTVLLFPFTEAPGKTVALWAISHPGKREDWERKFATAGEATTEEYSDSLGHRHALLEDCVNRTRRLFHSDVAEAIQRTPPSALFGPRQLYSCKKEAIASLLNSDSKRVVIIGDSAHATTTHRGMGANSALVDAAELSNALMQPDWHTALQEFQRSMVKRTEKVVEESVQSTTSIHATGWQAAIRPHILRIVGLVLKVVQR